MIIRCKQPSKPSHHNTQNISNAQQQQPSISIVELGPPNAGSHSDGKFDVDNQSKTTTPLQMTPEEVDYERNLPNTNQTNEIPGKSPKLSLNKYDNEVTTEKVSPKGKIGESYQVLPHEVSNTLGEGLTDVDTNIIDVGQQPPRNNSI